jgi:hypothetical protein
MPNNNAWISILVLSITVLLPIVPAYLLFRVLPSTGGLKGKLHGMEIKLGGAFAGYFAVLLLIFYEHNIIFAPPPPPVAFVWHLSGQVLDEKGTAVDLDTKDFQFAPPTVQTFHDGNFTLTIPTEPEQGGGTRFPLLVISHNRYSLKVPLDPSELNASLATSMGVTRDEEHREIKMLHITLKAPPPYNPTGPPPTPLSESAVPAAERAVGGPQ